MTATLELRGVSKVYGEGAAEVHALRRVALSIAPGELVAVMGPSGSGKSTLLTIAGSLEEPSAGEVLIDGAPLSPMSRNERARLRRRAIGYVFQDFNLLPGLTAVENVALPLELDGIGSKAAKAMARVTLGDLGLAERGGRSPTSCPAASGSGLPSAGRSSAIGTCSSPTSRRVPLTRPMARWS